RRGAAAVGHVDRLWIRRPERRRRRAAPAGHGSIGAAAARSGGAARAGRATAAGRAAARRATAGPGLRAAGPARGASAGPRRRAPVAVAAAANRERDETSDDQWNEHATDAHGHLLSGDPETDSLAVLRGAVNCRWPGSSIRLLVHADVIDLVGDGEGGAAGVTAVGADGQVDQDVELLVVVGVGVGRVGGGDRVRVHLFVV